MKLAEAPVGLLINFNVKLLKDGIRRLFPSHSLFAVLFVRKFFGRHNATATGVSTGRSKPWRATVVVLLCGGDKGSQTRDILKAKLFWKEYKDASKKL
jgi:hypothetical protein